MKSSSLAAIAAAIAAAAALGGCDRSPQTADGATKAGDPGTAASVPNGAIASTGSPEQGGANGTGPSAVPPNGTINAIDRATPDSQAAGQANTAARHTGGH